MPDARPMPPTAATCWGCWEVGTRPSRAVVLLLVLAPSRQSARPVDTPEHESAQEVANESIHASGWVRGGRREGWGRAGGSGAGERRRGVAQHDLGGYCLHLRFLRRRGQGESRGPHAHILQWNRH